LDIAIISSCRLRTPGGRLIAARDEQLTVSTAPLARGHIDGSGLAKKLGNACAPLLTELKLPALDPAGAEKQVTEVATGVYIEKREVDAESNFDSAARTSAPNTSSVAIAGELATALVEKKADANRSISLTEQTKGKRTQYILHNQGDTVYFQFGPHDRQ